MKVLLIYAGYPRLSQTYQLDEAQCMVNTGHEVLIFSYNWPVYCPSTCALPYRSGDPSTPANLEIIKAFAPQVIHSHYADTLSLVHRLSDILKIPFTVRTHSYDIMLATPKDLTGYANHINAPNCLGVITFPSWSSYLTRHGARADKVMEFYPSINIQRYLSPIGPRGPHIMSGGAFLPKKDIPGFIDMAYELKRRFPDKIITYYAMPEQPSYYRRTLDYNISRGSPVTFKTIQTADMPAEYLKHSWLIYGACKRLRSVGFPLMVAEAQAAGVMVIMTKLRPDAELYLARTGHFYETIEDIINIVNTGSPESVHRELLVEAQALCSRYDITNSVSALATRWTGRGLAAPTGDREI